MSKTSRSELERQATWILDNMNRLLNQLKSELPRSDAVPMSVFGLFVCGSIARQAGYSEEALVWAMQSVVDRLDRLLPGTPSVAHQVGFGVGALEARRNARALELKRGHTEVRIRAEMQMGLAADLLELVGEPSPSVARLQKIADLIGMHQKQMAPP